MKTKEIIKALRFEASIYVGSGTSAVCAAAADRLEELEANQPRWIPVTERLPENEQDVIVCVTRKRYDNPEKHIQLVVAGFHTDGKHNGYESSYTWDTTDLDMEYDEENDTYLIPEGWWECVEYGDEFSAIGDFVTHWMPLPEAPKEGCP